MAATNAKANVWLALAPLAQLANGIAEHVGWSLAHLATRFGWSEVHLAKLLCKEITWLAAKQCLLPDFIIKENNLPVKLAEYLSWEAYQILRDTRQVDHIFNLQGMSIDYHQKKLPQLGDSTTEQVLSGKHLCNWDLYFVLRDKFPCSQRPNPYHHSVVIANMCAIECFTVDKKSSHPYHCSVSCALYASF